MQVLYLCSFSCYAWLNPADYRYVPLQFGLALICKETADRQTLCVAAVVIQGELCKELLGAKLSKC